MELTAAIEGLKAIARHCCVKAYTDSEYVKKGVTEWMPTWKRNGWKTANNKAVKNQDLWMILDELIQQHTIVWEWVKGHSGHPENEQADFLARTAIETLLKKE